MGNAAYFVTRESGVDDVIPTSDGYNCSTQKVMNVNVGYEAKRSGVVLLTTYKDHSAPQCNDCLDLKW